MDEHRAVGYWNDSDLLSDRGESVEEFVESGQVEAAARDAAPRDDAEAREMQAAEEAGKSHAKGEDPALKRARDRQG